MAEKSAYPSTYRQMEERLDDLARMALDVAADAMQQWAYERDRSEGDEAATYDKAAHDAGKLFHAAWEVVHGAR